VQLPKGVWLDYWTDKVYQGGQTIQQPTDLTSLPVLVRAGSFVPMVPAMQSLKDYSSRQLELHYYHDKSIAQAKGQMYEDDGVSPDSLKNSQYELLTFQAKANNGLTLELNRIGLGYVGMPKQREVTMVVHQLAKAAEVLVNGKTLKWVGSETELTAGTAWFDKAKQQVRLKLNWDLAKVKVVLQ
jgi:oligosaccharide 4-alpha-D-glucosyltransferase